MSMYSHADVFHGSPAFDPLSGPASREGPSAPVSARLEPRTGDALDRRPAAGERLRVGVIGASGYVGGELIRLLGRHPRVDLADLQARGREGTALADIHAHLTPLDLTVDAALGDGPLDAVFAALPHGTGADVLPEIARAGTTVIDLGPDFRLRDSADYPRWYGFDHPASELLAIAVYGLPELHRDALAALADSPVAIVGAPGCYPTTTLLALAPLARAGLIADLVVDAKSGVSGAGREARAASMFGEVNESVRAYGLGGHRHVAEIEQELAAIGAAAGMGPEANPGAIAVDFLPHLVPMTRGIHATCHVRTTRPVSQDELDALYDHAYRDEPFVTVVGEAPATKHVLGSNHALVHVRHDPRSGRVIAIGVTDNLVKGAAGQAIQAFNAVHGLPETAGLEQLPLFP